MAFIFVDFIVFWFFFPCSFMHSLPLPPPRPFSRELYYGVDFSQKSVLVDTSLSFRRRSWYKSKKKALCVLLLPFGRWNGEPRKPLSPRAEGREDSPSLGWSDTPPGGPFGFGISNSEILLSFDMWLFCNPPCLPSGHFWQAQGRFERISQKASGIGTKVENFSTVQSTLKQIVKIEDSEEDWQDHF